MKVEEKSAPFCLETDRMILRRPLESDREFLMQLYANQDVMKHIHHLGQADNREEAETRFRRLLAQWEQHGFGMFFMEWKESRRPIGYCGPRILSAEENPELGYVVDQPYWGQGLALEAATRAVRFVQYRLNAPGMIALTAPENRASQNILAKLGFKRNPARDGAFHGDDSAFFELFFSEKAFYLETQRMVLRPPRESDRAFFMRLYADPEVMKFSHPRGQADTPEEAEQRFRKILEQWERYGFGMFLIEGKTTGSPMGYCGPRTLNPDENPELGYTLDRPYWGQGLAFEAAERAVRFVRHRLGVAGMVAITSFDNKASQTILTKLGFKRNSDRDRIFYGEDSCFFECHFSE